MRIYNNVNAINTSNQLDGNNRMMSKSLEKLSTGLRINRAADDAAGLSVSEGLRSQIRGSQMSQRNSDDALALLQIAESGAQEVVNSLQRMRELALQSANGTYSNTDRQYIQQEYQQLYIHREHQRQDAADQWYKLLSHHLNCGRLHHSAPRQRKYWPVRPRSEIKIAFSFF